MKLKLLIRNEKSREWLLKLAQTILTIFTDERELTFVDGKIFD